jgi:YVTN family beta-propeller protein
MRRFRWVRVVLVLGLAAALVGVVPDGVSAVAARARCRATAFVTNMRSGTVSTIDVKSRTKHPDDITVGANPKGVAVTPDGKTAFVANYGSGTVSTIDVKTRTKDPPTSQSAHDRPGWGSHPMARPLSSLTARLCQRSGWPSWQEHGVDD